jgi:hypothetical protein
MDLSAPPHHFNTTTFHKKSLDKIEDNKATLMSQPLGQNHMGISKQSILGGVSPAQCNVFMAAVSLHTLPLAPKMFQLGTDF